MRTENTPRRNGTKIVAAVSQAGGLRTGSCRVLLPPSIGLWSNWSPKCRRLRDNGAVEANAVHNLRGRTFYTSEKNDGHENKVCSGSTYHPDEKKPATGDEVWRKWEIVYTGNARVPFWIVRVPKEIISGHGGLWSDNSVALFGALYRLHFPVNAEGVNVLPSTTQIDFPASTPAYAALLIGNPCAAGKRKKKRAPPPSTSSAPSVPA